MTDNPVTMPQQPEADVLSGMYQEYFLDYASYVILERAVPAIEDGLKPVQRRILHSMFEMHDGRYHKVANIIGQTMQYHPHGDAAIGEALVNMGQKELLIDCQGNWGDSRTGDPAAAARYIEARLSKLALDILFNPKTTTYQLSYDGRKREPIALPVKFPLLLAQGVEGIAVGLSTKILPHNFIELIEASIDLLQGKPITIYPDFQTGGMIDVAHYEGGQRGGRVRVRARIIEADKKTLLIKEIPFGTTTESLIESIVKAADKGKIKIKKVTDNTAAEVEIQIDLQPGVSPDVTIDALYAFTDCEVSISPNACVIINQKPHFVRVEDILRICTEQTLSLLRQELEIQRGELLENLLFASLEKIFISNKIYHQIEECESWEEVLLTIERGLQPYIHEFYRPITQEDLVRLTEIRIKRISKYNTFKAEEHMARLRVELEQTNHHLYHLTDYAIAYYQRLLEKYGKGRERRTEILTFDTINTTFVVAKNQKLYANFEEGFVGYGLKKDTFVEDCSDIDDVIVFRKDGKCLVTKVVEKAFVGKDLLHVAVWKKGDERTTYNLIYLDGQSGAAYAKRFQMSAITRDREYDLTKGNPASRVLYFSANPAGEAEVVEVQLSPGCKAKIKVFDFDFATLDIKGRAAMGNTVTKYPVRKIKIKQRGGSTLGAQKIWFDPITGRLNTNGYGRLLGEFDNNHLILALYNDGTYELTTHEVTNRYEPKELVHIGRYDPDTPIAAIYYDGEKEATFVKRFRIETTTLGQRFCYLPNPEHRATRWLFATALPGTRISYTLRLKGKSMSGELSLDQMVDIKGWKALGNKFSDSLLSDITILPTTSTAEIDKNSEQQTEAAGGNTSLTSEDTSSNGFPSISLFE